MAYRDEWEHNRDSTIGGVMWITKLVRLLSHDLDGGLTRLRGKTLGAKDGVKTKAPNIGRGDVRILRAGRVTRGLVKAHREATVRGVADFDLDDETG